MESSRYFLDRNNLLLTGKVGVRPFCHRHEKLPVQHGSFKPCGRQAMDSHRPKRQLLIPLIVWLAQDR
jgi:hypothetical protein